MNKPYSAKASVIDLYLKYFRRKTIKTYDCDGVISLDELGAGIKPASIHDIIITGRSYEESMETYLFLRSHNIYNTVIFNACKFDEKTRKLAGQHKGNRILELMSNYNILCHYEDDSVQAKEIKKTIDIPIIMVNHGNIVNMENVRRP